MDQGALSTGQTGQADASLCNHPGATLSHTRAGVVVSHGRTPGSGGKRRDPPASRAGHQAASSRWGVEWVGAQGGLGACSGVSQAKVPEFPRKCGENKPCKKKPWGRPRRKKVPNRSTDKDSSSIVYRVERLDPHGGFPTGDWRQTHGRCVMSADLPQKRCGTVGKSLGGGAVGSRWSSDWSDWSRLWRTRTRTTDRHGGFLAFSFLFSFFLFSFCSVSSWTLLHFPLRYSVSDRKVPCKLYYCLPGRDTGIEVFSRSGLQCSSK